MWVKICANTNLDDAQAAVDLGADAVGFVFAPSKRQVTPEQVGQISAKLRGRVERVGVFGAGTAEQIAGAARTAGLHAVQLHGGYDPVLLERLAELLGDEIGIVQTLHWTAGADAESAREISQRLGQMQAGQRVLVDTKVGKSASGGTGITFDWASAAHVLAPRPGVKIIVAGGLNPANVSDAVRVLRPWGVDVASGVEAEPGRKDLNKVAEFIAKARLAPPEPAS